MSYIISPPIQLGAVDQTTSLPAAGGKVWFYRDLARTTSKPVYTNTGTPGAPIYSPYATNIDGSISLNAAGAFDNNVYLYPFNIDGTVDLYYVVIHSSTGHEISAQGNFPTVSDPELQLAYFIVSAGIPLNLTDERQLAWAVSQYVHVANYYIDSSIIANDYVAQRDSAEGELEVLPYSLQDGFKAHFRPHTENTGPSTFTFTTQTGQTTKPLKMPVTNADIPAGYIVGTVDTHAIGYEFTFSSDYDAWYITSNPLIEQTGYGKVLADSADPDGPGYLNQKLGTGAGLSAGLRSAPTELIISFRKFTTPITKVETAETMTADLTTGVEVCQIVVDLGSTTCDLLLSCIIPGVWSQEGAGIVRIHDGTAILCQTYVGEMGPAVPYSSVALSSITSYIGAPKTFYVYAGTLGGGAIIHLMAPDLGFPPGDFIGGHFEIQPYFSY